MSALDGVKVGGVVALAALLQVSWLNGVDVLGGAPDLVLAVVVAVALLRGSVVGAFAGFGGGLMTDVSTFGPVGVSALVLTLVGYWAGRYAETTGRGRRQAPAVAIVAATFGAGIAASLLYVLLGETVSSATVVTVAVWPALLLNLVVGLPAFLGCRWLLRSVQRTGGGTDAIDLVRTRETFS